MPGRISYNGIFIDFQNEWVKFDDPINSIVSSKQTRSGILEINKFFDQQIITATMRLSPGQDEIQVRRFFEYANDGSTLELWRDRDLGTYISFEGGGNSATVPTITPRGLQTNDKVAGTFTRTNVNDSAWYLDPSTGLMTVTPNSTANVPRFVAGRYGQHAIQIDGAAVNLITHPSALDNAAWTSGLGITVAANTGETLDPAGTSSIAERLTTAGGGGTLIFGTSTATGNEVAGAIWLKCNTGTVDGELRITGDTGSTVNAFTVTTEWQPFAVQADTSGFTGDMNFVIVMDNASNVMYAWGARLYDSAEFDLGTVGAASTSSITRNAELLTFLSANIVNRDRGTVTMWVNPSFDPTTQTGSFDFWENGDSAGANADVHIVFFFINPDRLSLGVRGDNATTLRIDHTPAVSTGMTQDNWHHIGFTYDATVSNGGHIYVDGAELSTGSSNGAFNISETGDTFAIGSKLDNSNHCFSAIDEIIVTQDVKPASWFQQRFSSGFAIGEGRNYWSSVRLSNLNYVRQALRGGRSTIPLEFEEVLS